MKKTVDTGVSAVFECRMQSAECRIDGGTPAPDYNSERSDP